MAVRLIWLPEAVEDLDAIAAYIAIDSQRYARDYVARVIARAEGLCEFPESGHANPEANREDIRELSIYPYRLIYRINENEVIVLAVLYGSRLIEQIMKGRLK